MAHAHPVLAVACTDCQAKPGTWCKRPSGHEADDFHQVRKHLADVVFSEQHGESASIERTAAGGWRINPKGYAEVGFMAWRTEAKP